MSTLTNIGLCKKQMSQAGWELFCKHKKMDTLSSFDPEHCPDDEDILLTRLEVRQYEYGSGASPDK